MAAEDKSTWSPSSWRAFPAKQQPDYEDEGAVTKVLAQLKELPPLIVPGEVEELRRALAEVAQGKRFILQGGDCAERFLDCNKTLIENKLKILLQMSLVLTWGAKMPTVRIGRMAGQFAKPRSSPTETVDGVTYPSFRGDNVNSFDTSDRTPDPGRLLQAYFHSSATINYARALMQSSFADIHNPETWDLGWLDDTSSHHAHYHDMLSRIKDANAFMDACGVQSDSSLKSANIFSSHEGLHLSYEETLTHAWEDKWYNLSAHFLWIGDRTRQLDGAHVEYFRGVANPIGIKVGPSAEPAEMVQLVQRLWPDPSKSPGKISLITRFGADKVEQFLPPLIAAFRDANLPVVWICDPMHGNTQATGAGVKTRRFRRIVEEIKNTFIVHDRMSSWLGGLHFELTGENVTECVGGPQDLQESDLGTNYTSYCDPRINYAQSMEVAFLASQHLTADQKKRSGNRKPSV